MSNITKNRKNDLVSKISELETYLENSSVPEYYLQIVCQIKNEIQKEKYGLVFEECTENQAGNEILGLIEDKNLFIENGSRMNLLIEGENLEALSILKKPYNHKIDVICIDPPYNTGMDWLNYSDHGYSSDEDSYYHSKWLSFMKKRLKYAYDLLSNEGTLFINIDEHETGTLLLLCHQIFGENNVDVLIWPKIDPYFDENRVDKSFKNIKIAHEYIFVCFKNKKSTNFNKIMLPQATDGKRVGKLSDMETILKGLGTTSSAKDELGEILGDRYCFQTPKPMSLIKELIRASSRPNSIVLDFFAGSGTTGHAVMDLNREDQGDRLFILVNNNENNICRNITYKRLKNVIEKENYDECLKYIKIEAL